MRLPASGAKAAKAAAPTISFQAYAIQKHDFDSVADAWTEVSSGT